MSKPEETPVGKAERTFDAFINLWRRRKLLCIAILLFFALPTIGSLFGWWSSRQDVNSLRDQLLEIRAERDKLEIKNSQYETALARAFPDIPDMDRLQKLTELVEKIKTTVDQTAEKVVGERIIDADAMTRIRVALSNVPPRKLEVLALVGDEEAYRFATMIVTTFRVAGWQVRDPAYAAFKPFVGLRLSASEAPPESIQMVMAEIMEALNAERVLILRTNSPQQALWIEVGSRR